MNDRDGGNGSLAVVDNDPDLCRLLGQLAFLAPDIVEAILAGRQPVEFTANRIRRVGTLPLDWDDQRRRLGFTA